MSGPLRERLTVHYVGSLYPEAPGTADPGRDAIREQIEPFAADLSSLSGVGLTDGERGASRGYVQRTVNRLADKLGARGDVVVLRSAPDDQGLWRRMDARTILRFRRGRRLSPGDLDYAEAAIRGWRAFAAARADRGERWRDGWRFQFSVPSPLSMAIVALGPSTLDFQGGVAALRGVWDAARALGHVARHHRHFRDETVREVERVSRQVPTGESIAQVEATAETLAVVKAFAASPRILGPRMARHMATRLATMINRFPDDVEVALHLCLGSLNNEAESEMDDLRPVVALANATLARLRRPPARVHVPVAATDRPARTDEAYYRPLDDLWLDERTGFFAGFVNNHQDVARQLDVVDLLRRHVPAGRLAGISTACGMGRYEREQGLALHATLADVVIRANSGR